MTRALVVDDSQFMRTVIGGALEDHGYDVVTASGGERAVEAVEEHEPDVVTMDVQMPGMDGIEAVERIMRRRPTPVLMLSAHTDEGAETTFEALDRGAVDFLAKPDGEVSVDTVSLTESLCSKIDAVADVDETALRVPRTPRTSATAGGDTATAATAAEPAGPATPQFPEATGVARPEAEGPYVDAPTVVVGASTGGPRVIETILRGLPLRLNARVLVVQHMPASFTERFAARLDEHSAYDVCEATDGARVSGGEALVARGGYHMAVTSAVEDRLRVRLSRDGGHDIHPSIDVTMESAAERIDGPVVGVALTGMGRDGVAGMAAIRNAGGATIAQDAETSPVFGIPKQAIEAGCVETVLSAPDLVGGICSALGTEGDDDG